MSKSKERPERVKVYLPDGALATCSREQAEKCRYKLRDEEEVEQEEESPEDDAPTSADIRAWAAENDVPCPAKGKVPASVVEAYADAH